MTRRPCDLDGIMACKTRLTITLFTVGALFTGCTELQEWGGTLVGREAETGAPTPPPQTSNAQLAGAAATPEALDRSTEAERTAALGPVSARRSLGRTVASLGSPAETGFWLKTPLVQIETPGQVRDASTGRSVAVRLIPIDGPATAGSRISLAAMRLLGVNLADLVTLEVLR